MKFKVLQKQNNDSGCFICGLDNPASLRAEFYNCENEDGEKVLITKITGKEIHQSYPGRMHGGVTSAILDEALGRAVQALDPNAWAVTIDLAVKFRKPVPLGEVIYVVSQITNLGARAYDGEGKMMLADGTVLATATAKYFRVTLEQVAKDIDVSQINRHMIEEELPEYIAIGE